MGSVETSRIDVLADKIAVLETRIQLMERSVKDDVEGVKIDLTRLNDSQEKTWLKDRRFWAGISAVPMLLLGGWALEMASKDAGALRIIHRAFGTEPALSSALKDDDSQFTKEMAKSVKKGIESKDGLLAAAIDNLLKDKQVIRGDALSPTLSKEIREFIGTRQASFVSVGLVNPKAAKAVRCTNSVNQWCLDASAGQSQTATIVFGANSARKVDIAFGINVREHAPEPNGTYNGSGSKDITKNTKLSELIVVKLDDGAPLILERVPGQLQRYYLDGVEYVFEHYVVKDHTIGSHSFPMHSISFDMANKVPSDRVVHVAVVVSPSI